MTVPSMAIGAPSPRRNSSAATSAASAATPSSALICRTCAAVALLLDPALEDAYSARARSVVCLPGPEAGVFGC